MGSEFSLGMHRAGSLPYRKYMALCTFFFCLDVDPVADDFVGRFYFVC